MKKKYEFSVYLGHMKDNVGKRVYLTGFSWDCDWYWGGGYIASPHPIRQSLHTHFNNCFLDTIDSRGHSLGNFYDPWTKLPDYLKEEDVTRIRNGCSVWEDIETFLDNVPIHISKNWWRIKDLYKQFYILKEAAAVFQHGGHCTSKDRNPKELNKKMADKINEHIEFIIIPEIIKVLQVRINNIKNT